MAATARAAKRSRSGGASDTSDDPPAALGAAAVGIDLGTTYSCVGVWRNGGVEIVPNEVGNRTTPSYVAFCGDERLVGDAAKNQVAINASNTVFDAKRMIGRRFSSALMQKDMAHWPFTVVAGENDKPMIEVSFHSETRRFAPEEISSMVLAKMKGCAESFLGRSVEHAVITVPAYFNDSQRQYTKDAGKIAGLDVLRIINEPTAAALAYGLDKARETESGGQRNVLIFDLGGGTFDVSLLTIDNGVFEVRATAGDTHLGGEDFDNRIVEHFLALFKRKQRGKDARQSNRAVRRLRTACERAKRTLSTATQAYVEVDALFEGIDFSATLTRAKFEELCADLFAMTVKPVKRVLTDSELPLRAVDDVVLVGGSTRIPKVQALLSELFQGKSLNKSINQDEAVAFGAAVQAAVLTGAAQQSEQVSGLLLLDVAPLSLGLATAGGVMTKIVPRNTTVPARVVATFTTNKDEQDGVDVQVYEGERPMAADNNLLGEFKLEGFPPMLKGVPQIEVTFDVNQDGILHVSAVETSSGVESTVVITNNRGHLSASQIGAMVEEAERFEAEDRVRLEQAEARNALHNYAYELAHALRSEEYSVRVADDEAETLGDMIADAMEWLEENEEASAVTLKARFADFEKQTAAITAKLFAGTRVVKKAVRGPVAAAAPTTMGTAASGGGGGGGGGGVGEVSWQRGPGGCIITAID